MIVELPYKNPTELAGDRHGLLLVSDFQVKLCDILSERGIPCPKTIKRLDGKDWALEEVVDGGMQKPYEVYITFEGVAKKKRQETMKKKRNVLFFILIT